MAKSKIGFSVYLDGELVNEATFDRPIINVGKLSTSTLRLDDVNVSRKHAVIEQLNDGTWRVTDLGSTNGTLLHGARVDQAILKDGDRISLGTTAIVVHLNQADDDDVAPVAPSEAGTVAPKVAVAGQAGVKGSAVAKSGSAAAKPEEIRGLGQDSFYKKRANQTGNVWGLDVALLWGDTIIDSRTYVEPTTVIFGTEVNKVDFLVPQEFLGTSSYNLISPGTSNDRESGSKGPTRVIHIGNPNISGDIMLAEGVLKTVEELRASGDRFVMKPGTRARLKIGDFSVLIRFGAQQTVTLKSDPMDKTLPLLILVGCLFGVLFLMIANNAPNDLILTQRDPRLDREKVLQALKITPQELEQKKQEEAEKQELEMQKDDKNLFASDLTLSPRELDMAPSTEPQEARNPLVNRMQQRQPQQDISRLSADERRSLAKERAQSTAMNQALSNNANLDNLFNTNLDTSPSPFRALSGGVASNGGAFSEGGSVDPFGGSFGGSGGFGGGGGGIPGGGPEGGPLVAQIGRPVNNSGPGFAERGLNARIAELPPRLTGELDAKTIQQYIRRNLPGIRWCYQERLQSNRNLGGKLTLSFTILPNGNVHNARTTNSNLNDSELESCITTKMERWRFPAPKDGGTAEVAYPLILKTQ